MEPFHLDYINVVKKLDKNLIIDTIETNYTPNI
jgi:hypothetical protein